MMHDFWRFDRSEKIAFVLQDNNLVTYEQLGSDVDKFKQNFLYGKGLFLIECDGHYRQYVAYLAALSFGCLLFDYDNPHLEIRRSGRYSTGSYFVLTRTTWYRQHREPGRSGWQLPQSWPLLRSRPFSY